MPGHRTSRAGPGWQPGGRCEATPWTSWGFAAGTSNGHAAGFRYSPAMKAADVTWNQANLDKYLDNPQAVVPGTTMAFAGVKDAAKRAEIIAYLKTL